jgi:hypothetical protein
MLDINLYLIDTIAVMNELKKETAALIEKLEKSNPIVGSTEQITTSHLKGLLAAIENADDASTLAPRLADLEQFWLSSVAWCSQLSKDIEKIIIIYQELL